MKMVPVLTPEQLADMSEEELMDLTKENAIPMAPKETHFDGGAAPYFFVRTKSGSKEIKLPPKLKVIIVDSRR
jgi:hypothetical protein